MRYYVPASGPQLPSLCAAARYCFRVLPGKRRSQIARNIGCTDQSVRNVLRSFEREGLACLAQKSSRPTSVTPELDDKKREQLRSILHQSPRTFGKTRSLWTLDLVAEVCFEKRLTRAQVSDETIRSALRRMGVSWQRARDWITSPDPAYARKKRPVTG